MSAEPVPVAAEAKPAVEEQKPVLEAVEEPKPVTSAPAALDEKPAVNDCKDSAVTEKPNTRLSKLFMELPAIVKEAEYGEMWDIELKTESDVPTSIVLEKFLRANAKDMSKARAQLVEALKWRKSMNPRQLLDTVEFDSKKFGGLGYVGVYEGTEGKEIVTWNVYGAVKDNKATFGDVEE